MLAPYRQALECAPEPRARVLDLRELEDEMPDVWVSKAAPDDPPVSEARRTVLALAASTVVTAVFVFFVLLSH